MTTQTGARQETPFIMVCAMTFLPPQGRKSASFAVVQRPQLIKNKNDLCEISFLSPQSGKSVRKKKFFMTRNVALFVHYDDVTCAIIFLSPQGRKSASFAVVQRPQLIKTKMINVRCPFLAHRVENR